MHDRIKARLREILETYQRLLVLDGAPAKTEAILKATEARVG